MMLLLLSTALATRVSYETKACPLEGGGSVRVYTQVSANTHGGWDSDLVSYSTQGQWREFALSTCMDNLFTVYGEDIEGLNISPEQAAAARARLAEIQAATPDPKALEVWDRYLIAAEMYKILGAPHRQLYQLYLEASWTARDKVVGVYQGLEGPMQARMLLEAGKGELEKPLDAATRKMVLHNLARVAHRGGWGEERDAYLDAFEEVGDLDPEERKVLSEFRRVTQAVEPRLQDLAIGELEAYLATAPPDETEVMRASYLLADLYRRRGRLEEAVQGFAIVAVNPNSPDQLRELAAWLGSSIDLPR